MWAKASIRTNIPKKRNGYAVRCHNWSLCTLDAAGIASGPTCHPAHMHALNSTWLFNWLLSYKTDVFLQTCRTWQSVLTVITIMGLQAATEWPNCVYGCDSAQHIGQREAGGLQRLSAQTRQLNVTSAKTSALISSTCLGRELVMRHPKECHGSGVQIDAKSK